MKNLILDLWEAERLPTKDALYFGDGRAFCCWIEVGPPAKIEKAGAFDVNAFHKRDPDEVTWVDVTEEIKLSNAGYCCVGEGSYGSEGFIACLDPQRKLVWVLYSEESNPFVQVVENADGTVTAESSAGIRITLDIDNPLA